MKNPLLLSRLPAAPVSVRAFCLGTLAALAVGNSPAVATPPATGATSPTVVLFVGNSFTHTKFQPTINYNNQNTTGGAIDENAPPLLTDQSSPRAEVNFAEPGPYGGVPGLFKKFADQKGLNYEVHIEAVSNQALSFHNTNASTVIKQAKWNAVVLQGLSTEALPTSRGGTPTTFQAAATALEQGIHAQNSVAKVYLYETWPRADITYQKTNGAYYSDVPQDIHNMATDLHNGYLAEYNADSTGGVSNFAGVAFVGDAWILAIDRGVAVNNPLVESSVLNGGTKISLWGVDYEHPSKWGAYLNALVLFGKLTGVDPTTLGGTENAAAELGIPSTDAIALQVIARDAIAAAPAGSGVEQKRKILKLEPVSGPPVPIE